ncbi:MAG: hypothetical protein WD187_03245 [Candidatus Woykebacteria bacterium]
MIEATILGHPDYAERLWRLLRTDDEPKQLEILISEFTSEEIREIGQTLLQKSLGYATVDESRLLDILGQHIEELGIADLIRESFKDPEEQ